MAKNVSINIVIIFQTSVNYFCKFLDTKTPHFWGVPKSIRLTSLCVFKYSFASSFVNVNVAILKNFSISPGCLALPVLRMGEGSGFKGVLIAIFIIHPYY